jgi:hypothetical protein
MDTVSFHGNAARLRLLAALEREGASSGFWSLFFERVEELDKEDLDAVVLAVGRMMLPMPSWLASG